MRVIGRVYRVISEAYPSTARSRINLVSISFQVLIFKASHLFFCLQHINSMLQLKPQDSFGEFDYFFLDLQKVQEIIRKHHQTFLQLF